MPDPRQLGPGAVDIPPPELHDAQVAEDAIAPGEEIRCVVESLDPLLATDPMPWTPYVSPDGFFYPKKGDRAVLGFPVDGPPVIVAWWPQAAEPDETF
jgi:hypothetical protein